MVKFSHFTENEKDNISRYKYLSVDNSISTKYMLNFWKYLQTFFPSYVAPNVISLTGLLFTIYAWYLTHQFYNDSPFYIGLASILCVFIYVNLDSIDGIHARMTKNGSPIGELVDHGCDSISVVFLSLALCNVLEITDLTSQWYIVGLSSLPFQFTHIKTLIHGHLEFGKFTGPVEILVYVCVFIYLKLLHFPLVENMTDLLDHYSYLLFQLVLLGCTLYTNIMLRKDNKYTANGVTLVYFVQFVKVLFFNFRTPNLFDVIVDGLIWTLVSFDLIVCKLAKKEMGQMVVFIALISLFTKPLALILSIGYFVSVICEIADYMGISILTTNINVYVCGVFDMMHNGHFKMMENALKCCNGTRLYVGVHNDETVKSYKRLPYMNHEQRCEAVKNSKYVYEVLPNAPLIVGLEELEKFNIHYVVCSDEYYSKPGDTYYECPRKLGKLRMVPYTKGISTSDLIKLIIEREQNK